MTVLVEGFEADQVALARHLARGLRGSGAIRLAGPGPAPPEAEALAVDGVSVEPYADLDADPGRAEVAYLDVWTPEVAPRVETLRRRGARVTCLADLLLERATGTTIGITGTAGKTTATAIARSLLRAAGLPADASTTGRLGNVWPTAELLDRDPAGALLLELTSSHLAFVHESPRIAVVTCFWPDHLELHGSPDAYRVAKEAIVRCQRPGDLVVVNADDPGALAFAGKTSARLVEVSLQRPVGQGVHAAGGMVTVRWEGAETAVCPLEGLPYAGARRGAVLVAIATAVAAGAPPDAIADGLEQLDLPRHRSSPVATAGPHATVVVDDGMAATPAKTAAGLADRPDGSVVLVAGGLDELPSGPVHTAPEERELLERACDEVARVARLAVLFGPAAARLEPALAARDVPVVRVEDLAQAVATALSRLEQPALAGLEAIVFSPMFPVGVADRERFGALVRGDGYAADL